MSTSFDFCFPTRSTIVPHGPDWIHEVKYEGYWQRVERDGDRVRLITRGGYSWTDRYPWIIETALKISASSSRFAARGVAAHERQAVMQPHLV